MADDILNLEGKVAVVTGGGDGIGKGCCEILAAAGAKVVVSNRHIDKARAVADEITASGKTAIAVECDVLVDTQRKSLIEKTVEAFGTVNILVNNAGFGGGGRENPFDIDVEYVQRIYMANVFAPWHLSKLSAPYMQQSGYGSIVNITSMSSINREAKMGIYASSKAALNHLAANLAYDFGPMGIRVNNIGPGATRTRALASVLTSEMEQRMLRHTPLKRLGEVDDIAKAVLFFASPMSAWVSGQTIFVNGGGVQTLD